MRRPPHEDGRPAGWEPAKAAEVSKKGSGAGPDLSLSHRADARGCPCGHLNPADCVRRNPLPEPIEWHVITVRDLGLVSHDRERCRECQAVGV